MIQEDVLKQIKAGSRVKVFSAGSEGTSMFEGLVLARKHGKQDGGTFTVRTVLAGVGVEKIFPIHSPSISKIQIISSPKKVHRSKLYFVRKASGATVRKKLGVSV